MACAGVGGHHLGGLEQGPGEPVELGEDHLRVAVAEVEQAPRFVHDVEVGQAQRVPPPAGSEQVGEVAVDRPVHVLDPVTQPVSGVLAALVSGLPPRRRLVHPVPPVVLPGFAGRRGERGDLRGHPAEQGAHFS